MPLTPVATPQYPAVPRASGVPSVARAITTINVVASTVVAIASRIFNPPSVWGVYDQDGNLVLKPDSIRAISFHNDRRIPDYPIEQGGFGSYNKVAMPYEPRVVMVKSGTIDEKTDFMNQLKMMIDDLNIYTIITPEENFSSVNLVGINYERSIRSAQMIEFDISFKEVRYVDAGQFTQTTQDPSGAATESNGTVTDAAPSKVTGASAATRASTVARSQAIHSDVGAIMDGMKNGSSQGTSSANVPQL